MSGGGRDCKGRGEGEGLPDLQFAEEYMNWGFIEGSVDGIICELRTELWKGAARI